MVDIEIMEVVTDAMAKRAEEVKDKLLESKSNMEVGFFDMCGLLAEAKECGYHRVWGFANFEVWVEEGSGLDISARQAAYAVNVARQAKFLGITRDEMLLAGSSKIKQIMSLNPEDHQHEMISLVENAPKLPYQEVVERVKALKTGVPQLESGERYVTIKLDADVKEIFDEAIELARKIYGDTVTDGRVHDISISKAIELICVSYVQDINNYPEQITEDA